LEKQEREERGRCKFFFESVVLMTSLFGIIALCYCCQRTSLLALLMALSVELLGEKGTATTRRGFWSSLEMERKDEKGTVRYVMVIS